MANSLEKWRKQIDKTDEELIKLLAKRFKITAKIGKLKRKLGLKPCDKQRESRMFKQRMALAGKLNLNTDMVIRVFKSVMKVVKKNHKKSS